MNATIKPEASLPSEPQVRSSELLECVECKTRPMESTMREGRQLVTVLQCQYDCETVVGPKMWARKEWNKIQKAKHSNSD